MTITENIIKRARQEILTAFKEQQLDGGMLRQFIAQAKDTMPEVFEAYRGNVSYPGIDGDSRHWTIGYYSGQMLCAGDNFSHERLEHLIDVREYFRQQRYKGFAPQPSTRPTAHMGTTSQALHSAGVTAAYQPSANLKKFVEGGEMDTIRAALRFELNDNRQSREHMLDALAWAIARVEDVCEPYVEKAFAGAINPERNNWTVDYYDRQNVYLKTNFAAERFRHLVDVRMHLRERGAEGFVPTDKPLGDIARTAARMTAGAQSGQSAQTAQANPSPRPGSANPLIKIALIVGGALAAAVILLTLVR